MVLDNMDLSSHVSFLLTPHSLSESSTLIIPWVVQFVASWVAFLLYMRADFETFQRGGEEYFVKVKLPTRHPLTRNPGGRAGEASSLFGLFPRPSTFWYSQLFMVPLVLFNQLIVWPLVSFLFIWPIWQQREAESGISSWSWAAQLGTLVSLMVVSDQLWYWAHRMLHLPLFWSWAHRDHHVAPQAALSATFVHPLEYSLFCLAMQLPFALVGFPMAVHAVPLGWGMFTGSGAHSGYSGVFANGDEHNAHHLVTDVNFGLLMIADRMWGTHWRPESGLSLGQLNLKLKKSNITKEIEQEFGEGPTMIGGKGE